MEYRHLTDFCPRAEGFKVKIEARAPHFRFGSTANISSCPLYRRFTPKSGKESAQPGGSYPDMNLKKGSIALPRIAHRTTMLEREAEFGTQRQCAQIKMPANGGH